MEQNTFPTDPAAPSSNPSNIPPGPPPENYLIWAILSTVLCCMPLGIVSIIKASNVNTKWYLGDYEGARKDAEEAKKWAIWSAVAQLILFGLIIIIYIIMIVFAVSMSNAYRH